MSCSKLAKFFGTSDKNLTTQTSPTVTTGLDNFFGTNIWRQSAEFAHARTEISAEVQEPILSKEAEKIVELQVDQAINKSERKTKTWKNKRSEVQRKAIFTNPNYVAKLLSPLVHFLDDYDSGKEPICSGKCTHNCKNYFSSKPQLIVDEIDQWWGPTATKADRQALLHRDILLGYDKENSQQKLFIGDKQCCKIFFIRVLLDRSCTTFNFLEGEGWILDGWSYP